MKTERPRQPETENSKRLSRWFPPGVSRGLYLGVALWLGFLSLSVLAGMEAAVTWLGDQWAQQGESWSEPVRTAFSGVRAFLWAYALPVAVVGLVWSVVDLVRGKRWALLGIVLAVGLPAAPYASVRASAVSANPQRSNPALHRTRLLPLFVIGLRQGLPALPPTSRAGELSR
jgi:RsiW-degrading membrane proteinase PrsW (M82 family)